MLTQVLAEGFVLGLRWMMMMLRDANVVREVGSFHVEKTSRRCDMYRLRPQGLLLTNGHLCMPF